MWLFLLFFFLPSFTESFILFRFLKKATLVGFFFFIFETRFSESGDREKINSQKRRVVGGGGGGGGDGNDERVED